MPDAILHVGTMKTGTSTLQSTLARNAEFFRGHGMRYLGWPMRTSDKLAPLVSALEPDTSIIVSDEGLWHHCDTRRSDTRQIADVLADYDITIVVYFRRPDQYVESWYSQGLKTGLGSPDLISFLSSGYVNSAAYRPDPDDLPVGFDTPGFVEQIDLSIIKRLQLFESIFPEATIKARPFESAQMKDGDIVADFFETIGFDATSIGSDLVRPADQNISPGADTVLFGNILRRDFAVPEEIVADFLRTHSAPAVKQIRRTRILRLHEAVAINEQLRPVFAEVQSRWGGGAGADFLLDWTIDPASYHESEWRDLDDESRARRDAEASATSGDGAAPTN